MLYTTGVTVYAVLHLVYAALQFLRGYQKFSAYRISAGARHVGLTLAVASMLSFPAPETARAAEVARAAQQWSAGGRTQFTGTSFTVDAGGAHHTLRHHTLPADYYGPPLSYSQEYQMSPGLDVAFDTGVKLTLRAAPRSGDIEAREVGRLEISPGEVLQGERYVFEVCLVVEPTGAGPLDWRLAPRQDCTAEGPLRRRTRAVHEHHARVAVVVRHRDEPQMVLYRSNGYSGSLVNTDAAHVRLLRTVVFGVTATPAAFTFWVGLALVLITVLYDLKLDRTAERIAKEGRRTGSLEASCWQDGLVEEAATRSPKKRQSPTKKSAFTLPS